jgi:ABC-type oligopeptide transport system substrate-binding subunit/class 3 adenylate cyclase
MICPQCGTQNPDDARFCLQCATRLILVCAECGTELPPQAKFCINCGAPAVVPPTTLDSPAPDLGEAKGIDKAIARLLPTEYADRLQALQGQVSSERRMVTILFSDVKGSTAMAEALDPEDWMEIMDGAFDLLIKPVYRYEGTLARLMGDSVLAFFGAPIAHEDDPERAVRAALEITAAAKKYAAELETDRGIQGFGVRVGINTGLVVVGEVGSDLRVEYTAMGDAVNLAARMEQNAPVGGVLVSHDTYRHVQGVFDVAPQQPLAVKGKSEPVQTYLVQRAKPRAFHKPLRGVEGIETRMVGREAELKHLQEAFYTAVEDGELQMVTIAGDAGVGKSRLLHEFDLWSELLPEVFFYFKGRAGYEMQNLPYGLIRDLVAFRFQIQDSDSPAVVREKLGAGVSVGLGQGESSQAAAGTIAFLLGFELGDSAHLAGLRDDAQGLRDRALANLAGYFQGLAAQSPVLILLEDLHWADDSSLDALNHLALALTEQPLMIITAARPELFERRPHWGEGQPFHSRLELLPLSKWDSRRLLAQILQKLDQVPDTLRDLVVSGAEGNPFFIEELIKMLVDDGVIIRSEEAWRLDPTRLTEVHVPATLTGVLQARLDRLPLEERTVLQQASVVGRLFWDLAVARINQEEGDGIEEVEIGDKLSALRGREMVFQRETSAFVDAREYIFKHALLREITYEGVLKRLRRAYHGLVADWLLEQSGERLAEYTSLIADHLELAGRTEEAVDYLLEAGDRARELYAHQEALAAYERALALLKEQGEDERAARTLMQLGLTHHNAFDFSRSRQAYEEGLALWQRAAETEPAASLPSAPHALRQASVDPPSLDPAQAGDDVSSRIIAQLFSGLVDHTPELGIVPDLAVSWEVFEDGQRYIFHLRDDILWSDGVAVTAGDFEYAWKRLLNPAFDSRVVRLLYDIKGARAYSEGLEPDADAVGVRALDDVTLSVELEGPTGYLLHLMACTATYPVPRHVVEAYGDDWTDPEKIVTNGPFTLLSWRRGSSMVLTRNPRYHGRFSGNLNQVELSLFPAGEWLVPQEMYEADQQDVFWLHFREPEDMERILNRHAGEYVSPRLAAAHYLVFNPTTEPFDDPKVRQAFAYAVDREALMDTIMGGFLTPARGGCVPPGMPGHSPGIALPYDPERARQLLAEAGYPRGQGFPVVDYVTRYLNRAIAQQLCAQWTEVLGVEIRLEAMHWEEYLDLLYMEDRPHLWSMGWVGDYPDPDNYLRVALQRFTEWHHEGYLALVEQARRALDQGERMGLYAQVEQILVQEVPMLPLFYLRWHMLLKPWVKRYPTSVGYDLYWKDVVLEPH